MTWPLISENADPWFDAFMAMVVGQDASGYAEREDRSMVLMGGGLISFDAGLDTLTWASTLELFASITGFLWQVSPATITLLDGQVFYVSLVRHPTQNLVLVPQVSYQVPSSDRDCLIAFRRGTRVFFRNGAVAISGSPGVIIDDCCAGGGGGSVTPQFEKFVAVGGEVVYATAIQVPLALHPGVLVHRNGLLLDQVALPPATADEYHVANVGPNTLVTFMAPGLLVGAKIFTTYYSVVTGPGTTPAFDKFLGTGALLDFDLTSQVTNIANLKGVRVFRNGLLQELSAVPVAADEYSVANIGPITRVSFVIAPNLGDKLFITYLY